MSSLKEYSKTYIGKLARMEKSEGVEAKANALKKDLIQIKIISLIIE